MTITSRLEPVQVSRIHISAPQNLTLRQHSSRSRAEGQLADSLQPLESNRKLDITRQTIAPATSRFPQITPLKVRYSLTSDPCFQQNS